MKYLIKTINNIEKVNDYEKEIIDRTGWTIEEVRRVLKGLDEDIFSPVDRQYYLEKISPF